MQLTVDIEYDRGFQLAWQLVSMAFDVMIVASAIVQKLPWATLNRKHFKHIEGLILVDDERNHADP